jgi:hypothetical protein
LRDAVRDGFNLALMLYLMFLLPESLRNSYRERERERERETERERQREREREIVRERGRVSLVWIEYYISITISKSKQLAERCTHAIDILIVAYYKPIFSTKQYNQI